MKYKLFAAPIFKHFIQSNPPTIVKLKSLDRVWRGQLLHKNGAISFHLASRPYERTSKSLLTYLHAVPSPINMTNMIRQHTVFFPTAGSPTQTWSVRYSLSHSLPWTTIEGRHHLFDINHCLWYLFEPKVTRSLGLSQDPSDPECCTLTYFSISRAHKYINPEEP